MKKLRLQFALMLALIGLGNFSAHAELRLAAIFGDNMVLQQQERVPVWGWAAPGATVTVTVDGQIKTAHAGADGKWLLRLGKLKASAQPATLVVEAGEV